MAKPTPLTLCPPADIDFAHESAPESTSFSDIYFSTDGGLEETHTVFLKACGLPKAWQDRQDGDNYFTIGELGFGTGLNFLACWQLWDQYKPVNGRLHFISVEKFPLDKSQLTQALKAWPELKPYAEKLQDHWPGRVKGFHLLDFTDVTLTLIHDDVELALDQIDGQIDVWFLDGFSPSKNPQMWSNSIMKKIVNISAPDSRLGTFTVARKVRDALNAAGFDIEKKPGFGRKRDRLEARLNRPPIIKPQTEIRPIIIGSGIAGLCLACSFKKRGINPMLIDPSDNTAASLNPLAIIKPRFDLQDRPESRFFMASYLYAIQFYKKLEAVIDQGIQHILLNQKDHIRFQNLIKQMPLPPEHLFGSSEHEQGPFPYIKLPKALVVSPEKIRRKILSDFPIMPARADRSYKGTLYDMDNNIITQGTHIIWACGFGIRDLAQFSHLNLRYSRGQLTYVDPVIDRPITYGGYAMPCGQTTLLGATHKRLDDISPFEPRNEDDLDNIAKFQTLFNDRLVTPSGTPSRSAVRVTTPSTLPMIFKHDQDWGLTGLGSRGFVFAPLLAEAIVARIMEEVLPISNKVWARFQARESVHPENVPE